MKQKISYQIIALFCALALLVTSANLHSLASGNQEIEVLTLADKTGAAYVAGSIANTGGFDLGSDKTLDNTRFEGKFKFSAHSTNAIYIGYTGGGGLLIQPQSDGTLGLRWRSRTHENVAQAFKYITTTEGNVDSFVGEWFELRVSFTFSDKTATRANVTAVVQINDGTPVEYKTTATVPLGMLTRGVLLQGGGETAPLYHDLITEETEGTEEAQVISLADSANYVAGALAGAKEYDLGSDKTLENTMFQGKFKFSVHSTNAIYIGYAGGGGLLIQPQSNGTLGLRWRSRTHENVAQAFKYITTTECNVNSFVGEWFELRVSFTFSDKTADRANVTASVQINDAAPIEYKTTATVPLAMLTRGVLLQGGGETAPLYHDLITEETEGTEEAQVISLADSANYVAGALAGAKEYDLGSDKTLENTMFQGKFKFSVHSTNAIYIGYTGGGGLLIQPQADGTLGLRWRSRTHENVAQGFKYITTTEGNVNSFVGEWFELRVSFTFSDKTATRANVTAVVQINDGTPVEYKTTATVPLGMLTRGVLLQGGGETAPLYHDLIQDEPVETQVITLQDKTGVSYQAGSATGVETFDLNTLLNLKNTQFEGEFKFTSNANAIYIGEIAGGGLLLQPQTDGTLMARWRSRTHNVAQAIRKITTTEANIEAESFLNVWFALKVKFTFVGENPTTQTTNVKAEIQINDGTVIEYNTTEPIPMAMLTRGVVLQGSGESAPLHHRLIGGEQTPMEIENISLSDRVDGTYKPGTVTAANGIGFDLGASESLDCTKFEDLFKFSSLENSENAIYIGIQGGGVRIIPQPDDSLQIYFRVRSPHNIAQKLGDITAKEAGITSFKDTWNRIGTKFVFSNTTQTTTDVDITVNVNDYEESYHLTGIPLETLTRYVTLQGTSLSPLYHGKEEDLGPAPIMNESFTKLTFDSYGIKSGVYKYNDNRLAASGSCEKGDLNRVIFSDTIKFSNEPGARILLGGGQSAWHGFAIYSIAEDTIQIKSAAGQPFEPLVLHSDKAGVKLTGKEIKITMSFEYVDSDADGKKDDVKFAVWFDGKAYQNRYFYLTDMVPNIGGYMGIYVDNKDASLTIKTQAKPVDFTEYGFTKNWKEELRLNRK